MSPPFETESPSLTPPAIQVNWKTPTEFLQCPAATSDTALEEYESRLVFGATFAQNSYNKSLVVDCKLTKNGLVVLAHFEEYAVKDWAVAHISIHGDAFHHRSEATFFTLRGALKHFCVLTGEKLDDSIDDAC